MKILLIEDEIKIAEFTMLALTGANFTVTHVSNGAAGLAAMLDGDYDLVVLDVMLPMLDGFEVLKKAREIGADGIILVGNAGSSGIGVPLGYSTYVLSEDYGITAIAIKYK